MRSSLEVLKYIDREPLAEIEQAAPIFENIELKTREGLWITWAICTPDDDEMMGSICLWNFSEDGNKAEIGYDLLPRFQGHGYMSKAVNLVLALAPKLDFQRITAVTHRDNAASIKLLSRFQFLPDNTVLADYEGPQRGYALRLPG